MAGKAGAPSLDEIMRAVQMMSPQPQPQPTPQGERDGVTKVIVGGVVTVIGAIMLCLIFWVGSSVNSLSTNVTKMSANVDQLQKSISDLQATQGSTSTQLADSKAVDAKQDARADAQEADMSRVKERIRILEGQKPIGGGVDGR